MGKKRIRFKQHNSNYLNVVSNKRILETYTPVNLYPPSYSLNVDKLINDDTENVKIPKKELFGGANKSNLSSDCDQCLDVMDEPYVNACSCVLCDQCLERLRQSLPEMYLKPNRKAIASLTPANSNTPEAPSQYVTLKSLENYNPNVECLGMYWIERAMTKHCPEFSNHFSGQFQTNPFCCPTFFRG